MRALILADIHANLTALEAVLEEVERHGGFDELWCLGDIVGYGPDPHQCIQKVKKYPGSGVAGNHDLAAIGSISTEDFNPIAAAANHWTARQLTAEDIDYLAGLPPVRENGDFTLAHGSPRDPVWEYMFSAEEAAGNLAHFRTPYCLIGHSHVPFLFECRGKDCCSHELSPPPGGGREESWEYPVKLDRPRLIINPGGVGQPRDYDPRAAYAVYDSRIGTVMLHRVKYDIRSVQERLRKAGLPAPLAERLATGC